MKPLIPTSIAALGLAACASNAAQQQAAQMPPPPQLVSVASEVRTTAPASQTNSLWTTNSDSLLSMRRAKAVGDLLTVIVEMDDRASMQNSLSRNRGTNADFNLDALFARSCGQFPAKRGEPLTRHRLQPQSGTDW
jgi:flagellar L-ring protein precursor FlgH